MSDSGADALYQESPSDGSVEFDASELGCYPVDAVRDNGSTFEVAVGTHAFCDEFGFVASTSEVPQATAITGRSCSVLVNGDYSCPISYPMNWTVEPTDYESICDVEAALGARQWYCLIIE